MLREPARPVDDPAEVAKAAGEMFRIMHDNKGVGLAATQVGISRRFFVMDTRDESSGELVLINPEIVEGKGELTAVEGCLSLPGLEMKVPRYEWVKIRGTTLDGKEIELEGDGLFARAVQHELDHLAGKLIIDRVSAAARVALKPRLTELEKNFKRKGGA